MMDDFLAVTLLSIVRIVQSSLQLPMASHKNVELSLKRNTNLYLNLKNYHFMVLSCLSLVNRKCDFSTVMRLLSKLCSADNFFQTLYIELWLTYELSSRQESMTLVVLNISRIILHRISNCINSVHHHCY